MKRISLLLTPAVLLLLVSCGGGKGPAATVAAPDAPVKVETALAAFRDVPQQEVYSSTVQAYAVNNVVPQSGNRIASIRAEVGDFVRAGQVLAEMDRVNLNQTRLRLVNDSTELSRLRELYRQGGLSKSDFEAAELGYNVSKASYENLLENTVLRSPLNGVVTARNYDKGDMYTMSQPIFTVQQITPVKMLVGISESDYTKVKRGDAVTVTADALPGKVFSGKVVRIYPVMDAATHTFNAEVQVRNEKRELRPGMYVRATVDFGASEGIVVPDMAVLKQQGAGTRTVYVLGEDNTVSLRVVSLGRHFDSKYEITSGLGEGELVVVKGQTSLKDGDKVEVAE